MAWAFTTVSATVNTTSTAGANATSAAAVTVTGNYGISNALFADNSIGGSVGANTLGLRQSSGTTTAPTTPPVAGATFVNGTIVHTITGYTAGTRTITFSPVLTAAIGNNASITLNPAIQIGAQVVVSDAVHSVTNVTNAANSVVTLFPQTGVTVPSIASGTLLTFYNPLFQIGTDTTIGTALAGLASFRSDTINAFADTSVGGGNGAVTLALRQTQSTTTAPLIAPTLLSSFINGSLVHRVTNYNAGTRTITFSPPLNAAITNDTAVTLFTPGVIASQRNTGEGVSIYTVHAARVRVTGTLTWNAWAEQLVLSATVPASTSTSLANLTLTGTTTLNGARSGWGIGSGSVCPTPALITTELGSLSGTPNHLVSTSTSATTFSNVSVQTSASVDLRSGTTIITNSTFICSRGASNSSGPGFFLAGTISSSTFVGYRVDIPNSTIDVNFNGLKLDGSGSLNPAFITNNVTVIVTDLIWLNQTQSQLTYTVSVNNISRAKLKLLNSGDGTSRQPQIWADNNASQGGVFYLSKAITHFAKNIAGSNIQSVKVYLSDTLNGNNVNWFTNNISSSVFTASQLNVDWDGFSQKSYLLTTGSDGKTGTQEIVLAYFISSNNRAVNLSTFVSNSALNGDSQIRVAAAASPTFGLFSVAPQTLGSFVNNGTRHFITAVTTNGSTDYTLSITPSLNQGIALDTRVLITNLYSDIRNKTNIAAFVSNAGGYNAGATTILIDNGSGARTSIQPTVNSNFIYNGTYHNVTAVGTGTANKWQLTIEPGLNTSIANGASLTLRNIAGQDFFDIDAASFPHLPQRLPDQNLAGTGTLTVNWTLLDDPLIPFGTTLANARITPATDAVSFYNLAKAWWYDNFESLTAAQRNTVLVTRSGSTLNAGSYNLILNSSVSPLFNFSNSTSTITIKTATFTDTLTTTGVITLSQSGTYSSGIVPSGGKLVIAANGTYNLTGWTFANGSTIEKTTAQPVSLSLNYESSSITNNSSGITLSNTGGGTFTVTYKTNTLSAPNFAADTKAYGASIISGTETQLFSTTLASAGLTQSSIELLTGTQVRVKAAYWSNASGSWVAGNFLDTTLSWSAQSGSSVASQIGAGNPDPSITQANRTTVEGYTSITTAAQLYDHAKLHLYNNYTATNFTSAPLVTRTGTTLNAGSYNLALTTSGSVFALSGNTIAINAPTFADTLTTTGTITLNNPSTTAINYASGSVPAGGTVDLATAGTYDLSGWTFATGSTISNTSGGSVTVWLYPTQVGNAVGSGANLTIVAKPQPLLAPNLADGTRAYAARVQIFSIAASVAVNTTSNELSLGLDLEGKAADFAAAAPWTQVRFSLQPGATLPSTTGNVLKDGGFYYWSNNKLYTSIANIPGTPVDFLTTGSGSFTIQAETELFNTTVSGSTGLSQSLIQPDGIQIRLKATRWAVDGSGNASATQFLDTRDSLITWSAFTGATVSTTLELEAVHEQIVATSYVQSGKYGQLFPAKRGDQFGNKFSIALEGVGTLQINADDDTSNPAGVELLQDIFLWWCWVRSTEAGIRLASYDTLTAINFTTYQAGRVEVENTDASVPLIIAGGSISFAGSSNGIAATSNAIYLNVDVLGVVAITGVAASDIRSAVGLNSANLDSQLGDITALVL